MLADPAVTFRIMVSSTRAGAIPMSAVLGPWAKIAFGSLGLACQPTNMEESKIDCCNEALFELFREFRDGLHQSLVFITSYRMLRSGRACGLEPTWWVKRDFICGSRPFWSNMRWSMM